MSKFRTLLLAVAFLLASTSVFAAGWTLHRGSTARTGMSNEILEPPLAPSWQFHTSGKIISSPATDGNTVYVGSMDGFLYAVDAVTGVEKWRYDGGGTDAQTRGIASSPCIDNGVVYVATRSGRLIAVSAETGTLIWEYQYGGQNLSSPVVSNGLVYCGFGYPTKSIVAIRVADGTKAWETTTLQYVHSSPAVVGDRIYVGCNDGYFRALNAATGAQIWSYGTGGGVYISTPAVNSDRVFCAPGDYDRRIYALNANTGAKAWEFMVPKQSWQTWSYVSSPTVAGSTVYVVAGYPNEILYALDMNNGAKRWEYLVGPASSELFAASPTICGSTLYVGSWDGTLHAVDPATGMRKWSYQVSGGIGSSAAVSNGWLYVGSTNGNLYAFSQPATYTSPAGFVKEGWNLVSVPAIPVNPGPAVVFSGIDIQSSSFQFWRNNINGGGYQLYGELFGWTGPVQVGTPYWFLHTGNDVTLSFQGFKINGDSILTMPAHLSAPYWVMFGHPQDHPINCSSVQFSTATNPNWVDWQTAYSNHLVEPSAIGFESATHSFFIAGYNSQVVERTILEPWYGYWLLVNTMDELFIRVPSVNP